MNVSRSQVNSAADGGLRIKVRDKIEAELIRTVSNHDSVRIGSTEDLVAQFQVIVDLLRVLAFKQVRIGSARWTV